jgi:hypothetical protein
MKRALTILLLLISAGGRAEAQGPLAKYGKWVLLAGTIGMHYLAVDAHGKADDSFDALEVRCLADHSLCALGPDGTYADPEIEQLYQTSLDYDQEARLWFIGGEAALAGAAALFIWELTGPTRRPDNIPFEPEVRHFRTGETGLGLRMAF